MSKIPPPAVSDLRVLWYARISPPVPYSGHSFLLVDGEELGPVPALVLAKSFRDQEVVLLHCDGSWNVLGAAGGFASVIDAKARAERTYPGVGKLWIRMTVPAAEARRYRDDLWKGQECSFCGRLPYDVGALIASRTARICDHCIRQLAVDVSPPTPN
jgi:hypothetical protein